MHELPITKTICDMAVEKATELNAKKIVEIYIKQGEYTDYIPEVISQYFELVSEGTLAEGAKLFIDTFPAIIACRDCGVESEGKHLKLRCPVCGSSNTSIKSGQELYIDNMVIED